MFCSISYKDVTFDNDSAQINTQSILELNSYKKKIDVQNVIYTSNFFIFSTADGI